MEPFTRLESVAVRLDQRNIDTDQIVPARFLRHPRKDGYGGFLFHDERFRADGTPIEDFPLNRPELRDARILVAGDNFGCGSSREGAVYALFDHGFRCVVAPSFGDIFRNNCFKNGVLPVELDHDRIDALMDAGTSPVRLAVDLREQTVGNGRLVQRFEIAPFWKECLLEGVDDIDLTMRQQASIAQFAERHLRERPWLDLRGRTGTG